MKRIIGIFLIFSMLFAFVGCARVSIYYNDSEYYTAGNVTVESSVISIDIEWLSGQVDIVVGTGEFITVSEEYPEELPEDEKLHYFLDGGVLRIKYAKSGVVDIKEKAKKLTVCVPEGLALSNIDVDSVSAAVNVGNVDTNNLEIASVSGNITVSSLLSLDDLEIESVSGNVVLTLLEADKLAVETVSGGVSVNASYVKETSIDSTSGAVSFMTERPADDCDVDTVSGGVELYIPSDADFSFDFDTLSGNFESEFEFEKRGDKYYSGNGINRYAVDTTSANVKIYKKD